MSEYGQLGYDPDLGPPDPDNPVQDQYTGTWEIYIPPNDDPRVGQMLADYVLHAAVNPMVYITNGEVEEITADESVTFEAHVTGGGCRPIPMSGLLSRKVLLTGKRQVETALPGPGALRTGMQGHTMSVAG